MDKLSKAQKDEYATAFAILALYDGGVSVRCVSPWKEKTMGSRPLYVEFYSS
jgi:hypothetical protein